MNRIIYFSVTGARKITEIWIFMIFLTDFIPYISTGLFLILQIKI